MGGSCADGGIHEGCPCMGGSPADVAPARSGLAWEGAMLMGHLRGVALHGGSCADGHPRGVPLRGRELC